jgi:glycosyltransferase involved in cell wall biosynthesis
MIYAPIDLAVAIAKGLAKNGHDVDFFAPLGSQVPGVTIESLNLRPLANNESEFRELVTDPGLKGHVQPSLWDLYMSREMFRRAAHGEYDLLYFHHAEIALPYVRDNLRTPVVYTMNDPIYPWYKELFELYASPNQHFVSISKNQRRDAPDLPYIDTIYNGIDPDHFALNEDAEDYLMIAGRIVPEKGFKEAIDLANTTNQRLFIIGPVYPDMQGYFDQYIKPQLNDRILYLGNMEQEQLIRYYQKAKAFVTPIQWEEPFGLTTIEAMSCGTPVITLHRGAGPELIKQGKTGFVCQSMAEMAEAVGKIDTIKRADCHEHVRAHFSTDRMVRQYETVFRQLIASNKLGRLQRSLTGAARKAAKPVTSATKHVKRAATTAQKATRPRNTPRK